MNQLRIKPLNGLKIRNPKDGRPLPADRTTVVVSNSYWQRRLRDKDVVEVVAAAKKAKPKEEKKQKVEKKEEKNTKPL